MDVLYLIIITQQLIERYYPMVAATVAGCAKPEALLPGMGENSLNSRKNDDDQRESPKTRNKSGYPSRRRKGPAWLQSVSIKKQHTLRMPVLIYHYLSPSVSDSAAFVCQQRARICRYLVADHNPLQPTKFDRFIAGNRQQQRK